MPDSKTDDDDPSPRRLPARLPRHLRACWSPWKTASRPKSRATRTIRPRPACCAPRSRATPSAPTTPDRLLYPMRRVGHKGEGKFERISWDEALDDIADTPGGDRRARPAGHPAVQLCRHHGPGAGRIDVGALLPPARRVAAGPHHLRDGRRRPATSYTIGGTVGTDIEQFQDAKLILIWGGNPIASNLHFWMRAQEAKRRGAQPDRDRSLPLADGREMPPAYRACCPAPTPRWRWA